MANIISPVTGKGNIEIVKRISSSQIIRQYKEELNIETNMYFEGLDEVLICECKESLYRFYHPAKISGNDLFYEELQEKRPSGYYSWRWEHEKALDEIEKNDYVLDIGCGSGFFLSKLTDKTPNVRGLEYNDLAIRQCEEKKLSVIKSSIQDFAESNKDVFDVVCAFQVLEHISDVQSFIKSCLEVLKPNGKLIIGVPNNNPYLFKHDIYHTLNLPPHHIGLWNKKSLKRLSNIFPMKNIKMLIEPNFNYNYWLDIQINHFFGNNKIGQIVKRIVNKVFRRFNKFTDGRNLFVVYRKK